MELNWPAEAIILHLPHASTVLPKEAVFLLDDEALAYEVDAMTDHSTDQLFTLPGAQRCVFPVSRLVVDPERFLNDPMESVGMGVVYTHTSSGGLLRHVSAVKRQALIDAYYHPHHQQLTAMTGRALDTFGRCLIIDCHSFPATPLPYEVNQSRPDICIGTDGFHTTPELGEQMRQSFSKLGYEVAINTPFAGALVPMHYYQKQPQVQALMIEINRGVYNSPLKLQALKRHLSRVLTSITHN